MRDAQRSTAAYEQTRSHLLRSVLKVLEENDYNSL